MQRLRFIPILCLIALLFLNMTGVISASASAEPVQLNKIDDKRPGDTVAVSGTSALDEIIVKVIRPDGTILYFDTTIVTEGKFNLSFQLSANAPSGTYTVVAGQGGDIATAAFAVKASSNSGNNNTTTPSLPETGEDVGKGIKLGADAIQLSRATNSEGASVTTAVIDAKALGKAIADAYGKDPKSPVVIIEISGDHPVLNIELPADVLEQAAKTAPNAVIHMQAGAASYQLPVSQSAVLSAINALGAKPGDARVSIAIEQAAGKLLEQLKAAANAAQSKLVHAGYKFEAAVHADGNTVEIANFGDMYVPRTITISKRVDPSIATAAIFDPATGTFTFVPSVFESNGDTTIVTVKHNGNGIYSIIETVRSFDDLAAHWAKADIGVMASKLIVKGLPNQTFAPDAPITRAEFTALLVRSLGMPELQAEASFTDVAANAWYAGAVHAAVQAKLVEGDGHGRFMPEAPLNREQMAALIARAIQAAGMTTGNGEAQAPAFSFKDGSLISAWARDAVASLAEARIMEGFPDGSFQPDRTASRAQATVVLKRVLEYVEFINK